MGGIALPRWLGVKHLDRVTSNVYQDAAERVAKRQQIARVHLDLIYFRRTKAEEALLFRVSQALHPEARSSGVGHDAARAFGPGTLDAKWTVARLSGATHCPRFSQRLWVWAFCCSR